MAETARGRASFEIKDREGTHWVMINVRPGDFQALKGGFAGLDIKPGTAPEKVVQLTNMLSELVANFTITTF